MKLWNPWHQETYKTMKPLTPGNLWNHETIDTTKPMKPWNLDTTKRMKPWLHDTFIIWHRHWHILISINSCTVTPSNNLFSRDFEGFHLKKQNVEVKKGIGLCCPDFYSFWWCYISYYLVATRHESYKNTLSAELSNSRGN